MQIYLYLLCLLVRSAGTEEVGHVVQTHPCGSASPAGVWRVTTTYSLAHNSHGNRCHAGHGKNGEGNDVDQMWGLSSWLPFLVRTSDVYTDNSKEREEGVCCPRSAIPKGCYRQPLRWLLWASSLYLAPGDILFLCVELGLLVRLWWLEYDKSKHIVSVVIIEGHGFHHEYFVSPLEHLTLKDWDAVWWKALWREGPKELVFLLNGQRASEGSSWQADELGSSFGHGWDWLYIAYEPEASSWAGSKQGLLSLTLLR